MDEKDPNVADENIFILSDLMDVHFDFEKEKRLGIINPYFIIDTKSKSLYKENTLMVSQMLFPELFEELESGSLISDEKSINALKVLGAEFDYIFSFTSYRDKVKCEHPNALIEEGGKKLVVKWSFDELVERNDSMKLVISY